MAFYMKMGSKSLKASGINMNGSPLPKCGDPGQPPCPPSQATADATAEKNLRNAPKVSDGDFKETGRRKVAGGTEVSYERKYNQTGTGESTGRPSYKEYEAGGGDVEEAKKYWAERNKSGTETKTRMLYEPIKLDPYGPEFKPMDIKANLDIQLPNTSNKPKQGPGGVVPGKGSKNFKVKKQEISFDSKGDGNVISRGLKKVKKSLGPCAKGGCPDY